MSAARVAHIMRKQKMVNAVGLPIHEAVRALPCGLCLGICCCWYRTSHSLIVNASPAPPPPTIHTRMADKRCVCRRATTTVLDSALRLAAVKAWHPAVRLFHATAAVCCTPCMHQDHRATAKGTTSLTAQVHPSFGGPSRAFRPHACDHAAHSCTRCIPGVVPCGVQGRLQPTPRSVAGVPKHPRDARWSACSRQRGGSCVAHQWCW
jgi:hypothetical protein